MTVRCSTRAASHTAQRGGESVGTAAVAALIVCVCTIPSFVQQKVFVEPNQKIQPRGAKGSGFNSPFGAKVSISILKVLSHILSWLSLSLPISFSFLLPIFCLFASLAASLSSFFGRFLHFEVASDVDQQLTVPSRHSESTGRQFDNSTSTLIAMKRNDICESSELAHKQRIKKVVLAVQTFFHSFIKRRNERRH